MGQQSATQLPGAAQHGVVSLIETDRNANGAAHFAENEPHATHPLEPKRAEILADLGGIDVESLGNLGTCSRPDGPFGRYFGREAALPH